MLKSAASLAVSAAAMAAAADQWADVTGWATPDYCSESMASNAVPALAGGDASLAAFTLQQVQVVIRHGARLPYKKQYCWQDFDQQPWACDLFELRTDVLKEDVRPSMPVKRLFRDVYDYSDVAYPSNSPGNFYNGTCHVGQLTKKGHEQQVANGQHLADAYVGDGKLTRSAP